MKNNRWNLNYTDSRIQQCMAFCKYQIRQMKHINLEGQTRVGFDTKEKLTINSFVRKQQVFLIITVFVIQLENALGANPVHQDLTR